MAAITLNIKWIHNTWTFAINHCWDCILTSHSLFFLILKPWKRAGCSQRKVELFNTRIMNKFPQHKEEFRLSPIYRQREACCGLGWSADHRRFKPNLFLMGDITVNYQFLTVLLLLEMLWAASAEDVAMWYQKAESQTQREKELDTLSNLHTHKVVGIRAPLSTLPKDTAWRMVLLRFWLGLAIELSHLLSSKTTDLDFKSSVKCSAGAKNLFFSLLLK